MPRRPKSRYVFDIAAYQRIFRHQRLTNDLSVECLTCRSPVGVHEPYSHHWLEGVDAQHLKLGLQEKLLLKRIEREGIDTFILCDESAVSRTKDFLLEAGMHAVPRLLRFLNYEANRLQVTIGFYVNVTKQRMYYESSPIAIAHHLDIEETVDMVFSLLLEKISSYVLMHQRVPLEACTIKRLKVIVKREWNGKLSLPLQYRVKCDGPAPGSIKESVDLALLTQSFINYHGQRFGHFPISLRVNLFSLRVCATTKELYVVPYLLRSEDWTNTPTFLIQTNVTGEFQGLHEIHNVHKFLKEDSRDHVLNVVCVNHILQIALSLRCTSK